ncbi:MAG: DUF1080 domain-containing protein [Armatimonadetes bacterium]|nr:DUF1080 domain-containing protein [Armatimonadota bacterium]
MLLATLAAAVCLAAQAPGAPVQLTVRADQPGAAVPKSLYGIFFEEINHAGDGGIYAELVRNRSLEDAQTPEAWSPVSEGGAAARISLDRSNPVNAASPTSLRVDITGSGRGGAANAGYWGIAVKAGARYRYALYAWGDAPDVRVGLENAAGRGYGSAALKGLAAGPRLFEGELTASATDPAARLTITATGPGTIWLDCVSLIPVDTWKGRRNGLRKDLAQMLADMRPAFIRFPGGCFVEGDRMANATRWKTTIGPIAERPGHRNLWGYRSTDGLGYHEYLQMCEDLGAEPLFVINCGMAHADIVPMDRMGEFVQDALDALEYANGPVTTKWGALRAAAGHPAPFNLRLLEVGNENGGPAYEERFALFHDALKRAWPQVKLISNVPVASRRPDIVDEHSYSNPDWFVAGATHFDKYKRTDPPIYMGEYAVTQGCGQGNLTAAVAEAAFMVGMERNSDHVVMSSYAPLFVNVNNRAWNPDAIVYDAARCFGTPSYHVQALFAANRPDRLLGVTLKAPRPAAQARTGAVGVGAWDTAAEFRDVTVTSGRAPLYRDRLASDALQGWRLVRGDQGAQGRWSVADGGILRQESRDLGARQVVGDPTWGDYTLRLKARKVAGAEGFLILFHARDDANWYWWNIGGWGNARHAIEKCTGGAKTTLGEPVAGGVEAGRWYDIRIELEGARIRCFLDGKLIHDLEDAATTDVAATVGRMDRSGEIVVKLVNASPEARTAEVRLQGVKSVAARGTATVLTSADGNDENSFAEPRKVAPRTEVVSGLKPTFTRRLPPRSVTVLRVKAR